MPTTTNSDIPGSTDDELAATTIFRFLANDRRRHALQYLGQRVGAVPIGKLVDHISLIEDEHTHDHYERICIGLVHTHIPKLADAGVLRYDPENETVELLDSADQFVPYLDLATPTNST